MWVGRPKPNSSSQYAAPGTESSAAGSEFTREHMISLEKGVRAGASALYGVSSRPYQAPGIRNVVEQEYQEMPDGTRIPVSSGVTPFVLRHVGPC